MGELSTFLGSVFKILFSDSDAVLAGAAFPTLIFAMAAALLGVLVVLVDYLMSLIPYPSFLKLVHSADRLPLFLLVWGVGAGAAAFLGAMIDILEATRQSAVVAGVGWPVLMTRIAVASRGEQQFEQTAVEEEEVDVNGAG